MASALAQKLCKAASRVKESLLSLAAAAAATEEEVPYQVLPNSENLGISPGYAHSSCGSGRSDEDASEGTADALVKVPKGFLPVLLAPDYRTCYVIRTCLLSHPLLARLLELSAQEFGYSHAGALKLPCDSHHFEELLSLINFSESPLEIMAPLVHSIPQLEHIRVFHV